MASPLNPMRPEDRMCRCKRRYDSKEEALFSDAGRGKFLLAPIQLYAYECPFKNLDGTSHWHLTKHPRPVTSNASAS